MTELAEQCAVYAQRIMELKAELAELAESNGRLREDRTAAEARLALYVQSNTDLNAQCMREAASADDAEAQLAEAKSLLLVYPGGGLSAYDNEKWHRRREAFLRTADSVSAGEPDPVYGSEAWMFRELMAVMHGDGGHYHTQHGAKKAFEDACAKYYRLVQS